ncbi:sugar-binding transcriptional regulator [Nocardioides aestuarii]|uniref:Sugar-binding transcriptional regulator n=1 Tax=Nocardioides aestuarii TaxID=252231 RepID=A0ABW4TNH5_9ACTN
MEGRSQAEVATALSTSRPNVSRMLAEAQRRGIVEIRINHPDGRAPDLESQLERTFGLTTARVARRGPGTALDESGRLAARLLVDSLEDGSTLALSWGHALQSLVRSVDVDRDHDVTLLQLLGGTSAVGHGVSGQELVRELASRLGADYRPLHAPATLRSAEATRTVVAEESVAAALGAAGRARLAFVGVGTPRTGSSAAVLESLDLSTEEQRAFWDAGPVGDLAGRFYDADGVPVTGPVDDRVVGVSLDGLRGIHHVVGVASGREKALAVVAALRGGHLGSLVCDETLARELLLAA